MKTKKIFVTTKDMQKLREIVREGLDLNASQRDYLVQLAMELDRSEVVAPQDVPHDVVTMNSKVRFRDLDTGQICVFDLVYPDSANPDLNKISVLAPIGTALLGYRVNDVLEWPVPAGIRRLKIEEVLYQPEAAGEYDS